MKRVKISAILVTLAMAICACGNESSTVKNEVEQEVNISLENIIDEEKEMKEDEVVIEESEETKVDELESWGQNQTEFDIYQVLGEEIYKEYFLDDIRYEIYKNGAVVSNILEEECVIPEEIEVDGKKYPVVGLKDVCGTWTEFTIPSHIKYIMAGAFSNTAIKSLIIPDTVVYISGWDTFSNCNLEELILPDNYRTDNEWWCTFSGCRDLISSIKVPDDVKLMSQVFGGCSKLTEIQLSSNLEEIYRDTFSGCTSLQELILPDSLIRIEGYEVFRDCIFENLILPDSLTSLDFNSFLDMPNLKELIIPDSVTEYLGGTTMRVTPNLKKIKFSNFAPYEPANSGFIGASYEKKYFVNSEITLIFPDSLTDLNDKYFNGLWSEKVTIHVAPDYVEHFRNKFPNITVVAKE